MKSPISHEVFEKIVKLAESNLPDTCGVFFVLVPFAKKGECYVSTLKTTAGLSHNAFPEAVLPLCSAIADILHLPCAKEFKPLAERFYRELGNRSHVD